MTSAKPFLEYPPSLQEYAVPAKEYLGHHPEYDIICTGIVIFNKDGKLLLVQRAAGEMAYPNFWVGGLGRGFTCTLELMLQ
jgi:hypothetical protein